MAYKGFNGSDHRGARPYDKKHYNDRPSGSNGSSGRSNGEGSGKSYGRSGSNGTDSGRSYNRSGSSSGSEGRGYSRSYGNGSFKRTSGSDDGGYRSGSYQKNFGTGKGYRKDGDRTDKGYNRTDKRETYRRDREETAERVKKTPQETSAENTQQGGADELPYLIIGRNAVREAVKNGRSIDRILVTEDRDGSLGEIVTMARDKKLVIREVERKKLDELCMPFGHGGKTANHQGVVAYAAGVEYCEVADILALAKEKGEDPFVIVLDGIEDPYNLGSIIRSAECAGAHGVIIGKRRSASVTAATVKSAAGATEYVKIAKVVNISAAVETLKKAGLWVAGADMSGTAMEKQKLAGPLALVIGSEGDGISKLVREKCDMLVSIPMRGKIDSLNAGVAAAVLMFEKRRQDGVNA